MPINYYSTENWFLSIMVVDPSKFVMNFKTKELFLKGYIITFEKKLVLSINIKD